MATAALVRQKTQAWQFRAKQPPPSAPVGQHAARPSATPARVAPHLQPQPEDAACTATAGATACTTPTPKKARGIRIAPKLGVHTVVTTAALVRQQTRSWQLRALSVV